MLPIQQYIGSFNNCVNLQFITIKKGIEIPYHCFIGCTNLQFVYNLNTCISINESGFYNCSNLENSNLSNCEYIGSQTFYNCSKVKFSDLRKCTYIGYGSFGNCTSLNKVILGNPTTIENEIFTGSTIASLDISELDSEKLRYSKFSNLSWLHDVKLKNGVEISPECFKNCGRLQVVYNLNKCTGIQEGAFSGCASLENSDINNCTYIGNEAFKNCYRVKFKEAKKLTSIGSDVFSGCASITNFDASNIDLIPNMFASTGLQYIKIKKGIQIPENCFQSCTALRQVNNLTHCTGISDYAFSYCVSLENSNLSNCKSIGTGAFFNCGKIKITKLPVCESIGVYAFSGCVSLTNIDLSNYKGNDINNYAFSGCSNLTYIKLPKNIQGLGEYIFADCSKLQTIENINTCKYIGSCCFSGTSLTKINLSNADFSTEGKIFYNCNKELQSISIKPGVDLPNYWITNDYHFPKLNNLTNINNLKYVNSIGDDALWGVLTLNDNTILIDDPDKIQSKALRGSYATEWTLPYLTKNDVTTRDFYGAGYDGSGDYKTVTFHCKDGNVSIKRQSESN